VPTDAIETEDDGGQLERKPTLFEVRKSKSELSIQIKELPPIEDDKEETKKNKYVIMDDNRWKQYWDLYIICLIMYVAVVVPFRLGFESEDTKAWKTWGYILDVSFLIDIILTFFTAYFDADSSELITDPKQIALYYLKGWFWIDAFSILPIETLLKKAIPGEGEGGGKINVLAKFPRIARLYSLVRFIRLMRLTRLLKRKKTPKNLESKLKLREGLQRLLFFGFFIFISIHIFTCMWVFMHNFSKERSWLTIKFEQIIDQGETIEGDA
jgi:hypothetical protein